MSTSAISDKIILNFGWKGPNQWRGGSLENGLDVSVVDLIFKNTKTDISVHIPDNIFPSTIQKFPFTCRRYQEQEIEFGGRRFRPLTKETRPNSLIVTVEQIQNLTIKAGVFEKGRPIGPRIMDSSGEITQQQTVRRNDHVLKLDIPKEFEIGQTYSLVITSIDLSLTACLIKEKKVEGFSESKRKPNKIEFQNRVHKMGEALIEEGLQNFDLALRGGVGVFDSSTTNSDVFAHGMRDFIHAGQQMNPDIQVPSTTRPLESSRELDSLTKYELQNRFEATYTKDKQLEIQRMQAAQKGDIEVINKILEIELINSQLLIKLAEALEKKGVKPLIPQSDSFRSAASQSAEAHIKTLKDLEEGCKMQ